MPPLPPRQARFVDEYLIDLNATQAAIRAGYSPKTAVVQGPRLLGKVSVAEAIQAGKLKRSEATGITAARVLQELGRIAFFDHRKLYREDGTLKRPSELDDETAAVVSGIEVIEKEADSALDEDEDGNPVRKQIPMFTKKTKTFDKNTALTLAMRHLGMLTDKTEVTGKGGGPLELKSTVHVYLPDNGRTKP